LHYLDRSTIPAPQSLRHYQHGNNSWDDVTPQDKSQIRTQLESLQGRRCAYCEGDLDQLGHHIEHFQQKAAHRFPALTFTWTNLFWSCDRGDSCGKFKDKSEVMNSYQPADLLKPDVDDPEAFFLFVSDGSIVIRNGLSLIDQRRAEETLRVFNLDPEFGRLRKMRMAHVQGYVADAQVIAEILEVDPVAGIAFLESELLATSHLPFSTAIKHTLSYQGQTL